jgi:hypothetical protein
VRSITELCGIQVSMETYVSPIGTLQSTRCQTFRHTQRNCGYEPSCIACGSPKSKVGALTQGSSLSAMTAGTTRRNTGAVLSGKLRRRSFQIKSPLVSERASPQTTPPFRMFSGPVPLPSRWTWANEGIHRLKGA